MRNKLLKGHSKVIMGEPKKRFRIVIQERLSKTNKKEKCRSFMLYDYTGKSNIDKVKDKLIEKTQQLRFVK